MIEFVCNLCGTANRAEPKSLGREVASCSDCGSTVRLRGLIHVLSTELFGVSMPMTDFPRRKGLRGLGMSDSVRFAEALEDRFSYTNTFYHQEPRFDVLADEQNFGVYDFIISSEVLEHIPPPPERGFETLFRMLKPNGVLLLTVPYTLEAANQEHFPKLHDFAIAELRGGLVLVNKTEDGVIETFDNLVFHGGGGSTLEMRRYSESGLRRILSEVGFESARIAGDEHPEFGVVYQENCSLPIAARKRALGEDASGVAELAGEYRELLKRNRMLEAEINARAEELAGVRAWVASRETELTQELVNRTAWARDIEKQLEERTEWAQSLNQELNEHVEIAEKLQSAFEERSQDVLKLESEAEQLRREIQAVRARLWVKLGRGLGLA